MRSIEEIATEVETAVRQNDAVRLSDLGRELHVIGSPAALALEHTALGNVRKMEGNFSSALDHFRKSMYMHEELGDSSNEARAASYLGTIHGIMGDFPVALEHFHRALAIREELGDLAGVATSCSNVGIVHNSTGDYPSALEFFHRAQTLYEGLGDRAGVARLTGNIGNAHANSGNPVDALAHYNKALKMHESLDNRGGVAQITANIGTLHAEDGDYDQAYSVYERALDIYEELGDAHGVAQVMGNIGHVLLEAGKVEDVRSLFDRFDAIEIGEPRISIHRHMLHARLLEHEGDLDGAYEAYRQAMSESEQYGLRGESSDLHKAMRDLAEKRNDFRAYIDHNNAFTQLTDEIKGKEATLKMVMQQKQRELETIERERERERAVLYSTLPRHVADRMIKGEKVTDHFNVASVIFMDIVGFTRISDMITAQQVVYMLEEIFKQCERISSRRGITKVKTIGDSYMAVCGVPEPLEDHVERTAHAALDLIESLNEIVLPPDPTDPDTSWIEAIGPIRVRVGVHCGPLIAGIVGTERLQYDIWGDTVNVASRMESTSEPGRVQVSEAFALALKARVLDEVPSARSLVPSAESPVPGAGSIDLADPGSDGWKLEYRGEVAVKGKGTMQTYWLEGREPHH
jgi:adenylate cyclase